MKVFERIAKDPNVMWGKPCIKGLRVTVDTIVGLFTLGISEGEILTMYPYLQQGDLEEALLYADSVRIK